MSIFKFEILQAVDFSVDAAQVPGRVSKLEKFAKELEDGTLKLRVRDSANERALRRSRIMQVSFTRFILLSGHCPPFVK